MCSVNLDIIVLYFLWFAGRTLSVTWSSDASRIYSGSSDGYASVLYTT